MSSTMLPPRAPTVAIIGGGALGVALVVALSERLSLLSWGRTKPRVVLFEKSEHVGRGLAYAKDAARPLLNTSAHSMSVVPGRKADFLGWLRSRAMASPDERERICAREIFGDYVEARFAHAVDRARERELGVSVVRDEVLGLRRRAAGGYHVLTHGHPSVDADLVVLAVGHLPRRPPEGLESPNYLASPYPSDELRRRIDPNASVAILGTGLSAIDAALALFSAGHEAQVTMASRGGLLPTVRGRLLDYELMHVTRKNIARATDDGRRPLRLATVLGWLELELAEHGLRVSWEREFPATADAEERLAGEIAAAEAGARLWQSIGEALNPMVEVVWHHLAEEDRRTFLDRYRSRFMAHWVPIPLVTAKQLLRLLREGKLRVERGLRAVTREGSRCQLQLENRSETFDVGIQATGTPQHLHESDSPLMDSLVQEGVVAAHDAGGVRVEFDSLRVIAADGHVDPSLFALGHLACGTHLFTSTLELNVEKADRIAAYIAEELRHRIERDAHVHAAPHSS